MKKQYIAAAIFILAVASAGICGGKKEFGSTTELKPQNEVTIKWMHHYGEESARQWVEAITKKFTEETGIKIEVQAVGYDDYQTLLKAKIASGDAPDIFDLSVSDLPIFIKNGYIADVSDCDFWRM